MASAFTTFEESCRERAEVLDSDNEEETAIVKDAQQTEITAKTTAKESSTDLEYAKLCDINVFLGLDDLYDALQILNQGLAINEKVHGKEHLATAACYNNIGAVMKAMGDNFEALQMLNQAVATFEKVYGKEHPTIATAYTNIGSVMQAMGNNMGALEMYNRGLAIREKGYGKEHPDTAESYNNIRLRIRQWVTPWVLRKCSTKSCN